MESTKAGEDHWLDRRRSRRLVWRAFLLLLALTVVAEAFVQLHPHFAVESLFGFHAWYGLAACAAMIAAAKLLGAVLKRPDGYYEPTSAEDGSIAQRAGKSIAAPGGDGGQSNTQLSADRRGGADG